MTPHQKAALWRRDGVLYLGEDVTDDSPMALTASTLAISHGHVLGPIGSGKTIGMTQIAEPLLLDPDASVVVIDCKPGGGDIFHKMRDFCFAYGLADRLDLLDFSNEQIVTGFPTMMPNGLIPSAEAKKMRAVFRAGVGQTSFDNTRQLSKFMFISLYTSRLLEMDLVEAWEILLPGSSLRKRILPKVKDPFLKRELQYLDGLSPARQDQLLSSSIALLEQVIADAYIRPFLTHRPILNVRAALQQRRHIFMNMGHDAPLSIDDVRILARMAVNTVITSVFANKGKYGPTYIILDECHLTLSRDISLALDTGRSLGLRAFLIHQYLGQLVEEDGSRLLYDSVMSSGRIKLIFGGLSTADLEILENETRLGEVDIYKCKHTLYSLETHQRESTRTVISEGESYQYSRGMSWPTSTTDTVSTATSRGTQHSITESEQESEAESFGDAWHEMESTSRSTGRSVMRGETDMASVSDARAWSEAASDGRNWTDMESDTENWNSGEGTGSGEHQGLGYTLTADDVDDENPDPELARVHHYTQGTNTLQTSSSGTGGSRSRAHATGGNESRTRGVAGAHTTSAGRALTTSNTASEIATNGSSRGRTQSHTIQRSHSHGVAVQFGESEQVTNGTSQAVSRGVTPSETESRGMTRSVSNVPFYEIEQRLRVSNIEYVSREEQAIQHMQQMKYQRIAHCMLSVPMNPEVAFFRFDWVKPIWISEQQRETDLARVYAPPYHTARAQCDEVIDTEAREVSNRKSAPALPSPAADDETEEALWERWLSGARRRQGKK